jgi:hypothetical protein
LSASIANPKNYESISSDWNYTGTTSVEYINMKILFICWLDPATTDYPLFMAREWEKEGHDVYLFPYGLEFSNLASSRLIDQMALGDPATRFSFIEKRVDAECNRFRPDVLLVGGVFLTPEAINKLRKKHSCLVGSIIGYNHLLEGRTVEILRVSDFVINHDSYLTPLLRGKRYGKIPHVFFMPSMAAPEEHRPLQLSPEDVRDYGADVAFIGGIGGNRVEGLLRLTSFDLRIWGSRDWILIPELAGCFRDEPVYGLKKTKIYNAASIVLNIEDDEKQINAFSQRIPEVLSCGGFVITDWRKDLEKTDLVDGESIVTYRTLDDLQEKVQFYLEHPVERMRIAENGRRIVLESLTYNHLAIPLVRQIENLVLGNGG